MTSFSWFRAKLDAEAQMSAQSSLTPESGKGFLCLEPHSLDGTANQLSEVTGDDPEGQVFPSRCGGGKRHDRPGLGHIPAPDAGALDESAEDKILRFLSARWSTSRVAEIVAAG